MSVESFHRFQEALANACARAGRSPESIEVLAVSKGQSIETLRSALSIPDFPLSWGENYLNELEAKAGLAEFAKVHWHYLGALQSRKIESALSLSECLQGVSRKKELDFIAKFMAPLAKKSFFIQVNLSGEEQKLGANPDSLSLLLEVVEQLGLSQNLRGLMGVASDLEGASEKKVREEFARLRELRDRHLPKGKLSMGMSADYALAICEGSDMIRVGTLLFGERNYT